MATPHQHPPAASTEVGKLIEQLRTRSGWWSGDDNATKLLTPIIAECDALRSAVKQFKSELETLPKQMAFGSEARAIHDAIVARANALLPTHFFRALCCTHVTHITKS